MPAAATVQVPPRATSLASLTAILTNERNLLHLHLYKAKNQHRTSLWFKHLRILKRAVERLLQHLQTTFPDETSQHDSSVSNSDDNDSDSDDSDQQLRDKLAADAVFAKLLSRVQDTVIPSSFAAFTHLTTSTQYAGLSMVLLGCLARVHAVLEPFKPTHKRRQEPPIHLQHPATLVKEPDGGDQHEDEDVGEIISRDSVALLHNPKSIIDTRDPTSSKPKRQIVEIRTAAMDEQDSGLDTTAWDTASFDESNETKKKTAIDDLFADL
ncbi:hypothetical protein ABW21_db0206190 [Orbilia brochopaga]|nr:hypothetical protein ABW21_db0206190 [Drechslerella brochopaga]